MYRLVATLIYNLWIKYRVNDSRADSGFFDDLMKECAATFDLDISKLDSMVHTIISENRS